MSATTVETDQRVIVDAVPTVNRLADWVVKRGVLFVLTTAPLGALFLGLFRITTPRYGYLYLLLASIALPAWVAIRRARSTDASEPAHRFHVYALYALIPVAVFSLVRMPVRALTGFVFWVPWYGFGAAATGEPHSTFGTLLPGALLYTLQGWALGMSYYILFQRHTLLNAVLYLTGFVSALYSFVFPVFLMVGLPDTLPFHIVNFWAHTAMAFAVWAMPRLWEQHRPRWTRAGRGGLIAALALVFAAPYTYTFLNAGFWQFPEQERVERAAFGRVQLSLAGPPVVGAAGPDARYEYTLRVGPRAYRNYAGIHKGLDGNDLQIQGQLRSGSRVVAWCAGAADALPTARTQRDPEKFFATLARIDHSTVTVRCAGPSAAVRAGDTVELTWIAQVTLHAERRTDRRTYTGAQLTQLAAGAPTVLPTTVAQPTA